MRRGRLIRSEARRLNLYKQTLNSLNVTLAVTVTPRPVPVVSQRPSYWISSPTCDTCAHTVSAQIPMSLQTVNHDVIAIVLSYLEPKQALPLTTTCRSLHIPATQRLLSEYSATFSDSCNDDGTDRLLKFCEYMLACPQRRLPCLKVLDIETWALIPPSLALTGLAGVVSGAKNLHTVAVRDYGGLFLEMNPLVMNAIADIDSLERLTLEAFTSSILLSLLSRMKSRPHTVTCLANHSDPYTSYALSYPEPLPRRFLHNLADGLREVTLAGALPIMNSAIVCPHVEVLTLNDFMIKAEEWESIVHTFPNVRIFRATARVVPVFNASVPPRAGWPDLDMVQM